MYMGLMYMGLMFVCGMLLGCFYTGVGLRVPKKGSIVSKAIKCKDCREGLPAVAVEPLVRDKIKGEHCRGCKTKIKVLYPVMGFITGVMFVFSYYMIGLSAELAVALLFVSLLVIISVTDIAYLIIPNKVLLPFALLLGVARLVSPLTPWWDSILGAVVGFSILYIVALIYKDGMGGGDVKLFFVIGLVLGVENIVITLLLATVVGIITGLILIQTVGKGKSVPIPFGTSIAIGAVITYFWGAQIADWYWGIMW